DHKLYVDEFVITKGETKRVAINLDNPTYVPTGIQFDIKLTGGIKITSKPSTVSARLPKGVDEDGEQYDNFQVFWGEIEPGLYRGGVMTLEGTPFSGKTGAILRVSITTTEDFGKEPISITFPEVKLSNNDDTSTSFLAQGVTTEGHEAKPLAEILAGENQTDYYIADAIKVVGKSANGKVFATDGNDNWINLSVPEGVILTEGVSYVGEQFGGTMTGAGVNPGLEMKKVFGTAESKVAVAGDVEVVDMTQPFALSSNQVVAVTGYYFNDDNQETLRAYSGNNGVRGQSLTIDNSWLENAPAMTNATPYTVKKAAVQLKAAWDVPAGARVAQSDELAFQNYIIYPLQMAEIATGINELTVGSSDKVYKTIENGQVIIVKGDVRYNIMGQPVR
ncbi:MAG: hypothetical protein KBT09_08690, partial [Bacteroidales bacterium]|nr:hypothetical protein [Candidatus Sodaliphilus fimicaballi]